MGLPVTNGLVMYCSIPQRFPWLHLRAPLVVVVQEVPEDPTKAIWSDESATQGNAGETAMKLVKYCWRDLEGIWLSQIADMDYTQIISLLIIDFFDSHMFLFLYVRSYRVRSTSNVSHLHGVCAISLDFYAVLQVFIFQESWQSTAPERFRPITRSLAASGYSKSPPTDWMRKFARTSVAFLVVQLSPGLAGGSWGLVVFCKEDAEEKFVSLWNDMQYTHNHTHTYTYICTCIHVITY